MIDQRYLDEVIQRYYSLGLNVNLIESDTIRHLRGCQWCIDLNHKNIDSVVIYSKKSNEGDSKSLYMYEYSLRGSIKYIPPDRKIIYLISTWKGIINQRLLSLDWFIPKETNSVPSHLNRQGLPPKRGEIWETGPHFLLLNSFRNDDHLNTQLMELTKTIGKEILIIYSDKWGESIRFSCNVWRKNLDALGFYTSPLYLQVAQIVLKHIQTVRRIVGGLTY